MKPEALDKLEKACERYVGCASAGCALDRLDKANPDLVTGELCPSLSRIAQAAGFTVAEAYGIMDGWDAFTSGFGIFKEHLDPNDAEQQKQYAQGKVVGYGLARKYA